MACPSDYPPCSSFSFYCAVPLLLLSWITNAVFIVAFEKDYIILLLFVLHRLEFAFPIIQIVPPVQNPLHSVWKSTKSRIWMFQFWQFPTNFCPLKIDLSGNTVQLQCWNETFLWFSNTVHKKLLHWLFFLVCFRYPRKENLDKNSPIFCPSWVYFRISNWQQFIWNHEWNKVRKKLEKEC